MYLPVVINLPGKNAQQSWTKGMWWLKWNFCIVKRTLLTPDNPWLCFECWTSLLEPAVGERQKRSEWKNVNKVNSEFWDEKGEPEMGVSDESCVGAQKSKRNPLWVQWDEGLSTNYVILDEGGGTKIAITTKSYAFHKCTFWGDGVSLDPKKSQRNLWTAPSFLFHDWKWSDSEVKLRIGYLW